MGSRTFLTDIDEKLYAELSKKLPKKQDQELLRTLLDTLRRDGPKSVAAKVDELTEDIAGDI